MMALVLAFAKHSALHLQGLNLDDYEKFFTKLVGDK